jgi:hypothetical protein
MTPRLPFTVTTVGTTVKKIVRALAARVERFDDRGLDALQRNLLALLLAAALLPIGEGNLIKDVAFTAGAPVVIAHYLERAYVDAIVLTPSAPARFSKVAQAAALDSKQVTLQADADCTASVYVF